MLKSILTQCTVFASSALASIALTPHALAQPPAVPPVVRMVVPFAAGASTDVIARAVAYQLGPRLGTTVVVENRPGGSGMIGASAVARSPNDGSSLLFVSVSLLSAAATMKAAPVDVLHDLVPVSILAEGPLVIAVSSKSDIKTPADLIAAARAKPNELTHGSGGVGTIAHLAGELLNETAKIQIRHIPYKGASPAVTDMIGGRIDAMFAVKTTFASQVDAGRARLIAVTSLRPSPAFPGLPTVASVVPGYEVNLWTAVFAPAGTSAALVQRLNHEINEIAKSKQIRELMQSDGALPLALTPAEASARVESAYATWKRLAVAKKIVLE